MTGAVSCDGPKSPSRQAFGASAPALVEVYAHKPLPPLPLKLRSNRLKGRSSSSPMVLPSWRSEPRTTAADKEMTCQPRLVGVTRSHTRWRSAYKVQQLTGYDVDVMDDCVPDSDSSSLYSDDGYGYGHGAGYNLVPLIEADRGEVLGSAGSSWAWALPTSASSLPYATGSKSRMRNDSDAGLSDHAGTPGSKRALGEALVKRWDPAYGQFTDSKAAGEYHRIATELAARPSSSSEEKPEPPPKSRLRKRPSLNVGLARREAHLPPRRRNTSHAISVVVGPTPPLEATKPRLEARTCSTSSNESEARSARRPGRPKPVSAFDSDSSDDEARTAGSGIREWFGRRSDEGALLQQQQQQQQQQKHHHHHHLHHHLQYHLGHRRLNQLKTQQDEPGSRVSPGEHVRELLLHAKDRARLLQMSRDERRREELRRHIRRLPS